MGREEIIDLRLGSQLNYKLSSYLVYLLIPTLIFQVVISINFTNLSHTKLLYVYMAINLQGHMATSLI